MPLKNHCPLCRKPSVAEFTPFCSRGCRDRDLLAWLGESYRMPARPTDDDGEQGEDDIGQ